MTQQLTIHQVGEFHCWEFNEETYSGRTEEEAVAKLMSLTGMDRDECGEGEPIPDEKPLCVWFESPSEADRARWLSLGAKLQTDDPDRPANWYIGEASGVIDLPADAPTPWKIYVTLPAAVWARECANEGFVCSPHV